MEQKSRIGQRIRAGSAEGRSSISDDVRQVDGILYKLIVLCYVVGLCQLLSNEEGPTDAALMPGEWLICFPTLNKRITPVDATGGMWL